VRPSFELGRAFPKTLFTFPGVAIRRCVPTDVLHSEPINFEHPCLVCSWRRSRAIFTARPRSFRGLRLVLVLRGVHPRTALPLRLSARRERVHRRARGPPMRNEARGRAFHDARPPGEPLEPRGGVFVLSTRSRIDRTLDVSVASSAIALRLGFSPDRSDREGRQDRPPTRARESWGVRCRPETPSIAENRTHTAHAPKHVREPCRLLPASSAHVMRIALRWMNRPPFRRRSPRDACAPRFTRRLDAPRWGSTVSTELPFTCI